MTAIGMDFGAFDLPDRNQMAARTISRYARVHAAADAVIGLAGFLPIPGAAPASIVAALVLQIPVYKRLAAELRQIYSGPIDDSTADGIVMSGMAFDSAVSVGADVGVGAASAIIDQFGREFFGEIRGELIKELGVGFGVSFVPFFGGFISTGLDVAIAVTMTWRVGTMVSIYYQNGERWIGSRKETYESAKGLTGGISTANTGRVDLDGVFRRESAVERHHVEKLSQFLESLLNVAPDLSDTKLREILRKKNVPEDLADKVIKQVRGQSPE